MKDVVTIEPKWFCNECEYGCCIESGEEVTISINGKKVKEFRVGEFDSDATATVLEALGFEVEIKYI